MNIRSLYLYLFSFIGLLIVVIGTVQIVDLVLTVYVFDEADRYEYYVRAPLEPGNELDPEKQAEYEEELREQNDRDVLRQRQRQLSSAISMIVVGIPLYLYHWRIISREAGAFELDCELAFTAQSISRNQWPEPRKLLPLR